MDMQDLLLDDDDLTKGTASIRVVPVTDRTNEAFTSKMTGANPKSMDQIGEAVETAISLLANASIKLSLTRMIKN